MYAKSSSFNLQNPKSLIHGMLTLLMLLSAVLISSGSQVQAASHREAPLISMDASADITDFFMFRSYEAGHEGNVVLIMDVIPGQEPSSGPNYFNFDPNVIYKFEIDNDADGNADDITFEFQFKNEFRGTNRNLGLFLSYVALPPITALDGAGSEGLGWRQRYDVTLYKNGKKKDKLADDLIAVPSNVGPRTMPDYDALADQGLYDLDDGARVFVGQREDPFYIDLGAIFDTLNTRRPAPLLTAAEDADDTTNPFGVDMLSGFNVSTIALEVPISWLTKDGLGDDTAYPKIGAYASTYRNRAQVLRSSGINWDTPTGDEDSDSAVNAAANNSAISNLYLPTASTGVVAAQSEQVDAESDLESTDSMDAQDAERKKSKYIQVQRLANPLVNEAIIGTIDKDYWNALSPEQEAVFLDYYLNPRLALALETVFGVAAEKANRTDLVNLLLTYGPGSGSDSDSPDYSELLRLDVSVAPTALASQKRLTVLAGDNAGWPNGRRPVDDVTDIAIRVIGGANYVAGLAGDGVNTNDNALSDTFPFLASPFDGRNRVHENP